MTIFGLRIMRERIYQLESATAEELLKIAVEECETWKAKYFYAKARAVVAEQFQRNTILTVKPVAMGVDSGVRIEVGHKSETEIREA
jgi:hypothetical protein